MTAGTGYQMEDGRFADVEACTVLGSQAMGAGQTIGAAFEMGGRSTLRLRLDVSAKSGTNPTLDVTLQTSSDKIVWRTLGTFDQKSDVGLAMGAVSSSGTTPPAITLSGTATKYVNLRIECTTLGARGVAVIRYSLDGGVTWTENVTTAATITLGDSGLTANYANATAAVDNVWTAKTAGHERKSFGGCGRYVRAVSTVGGSNTPVMTAAITGEAV